MAKPAKNSNGLDAYFEHYYFQVNEQKKHQYFKFISDPDDDDW